MRKIKRGEGKEKRNSLTKGRKGKGRKETPQKRVSNSRIKSQGNIVKVKIRGKMCL